MRANYRWLCAVLLGCWLTSEAFGQQGIPWQPNVVIAQRLAAQSNRLVLIHFWSTTCPPCQRMERDVFPRPEVIAAIEAAYVPVKLNVEQFEGTARQFGVTALPTDVILTPQGQVLCNTNSYKPPAEYLSMLNQVAATARPATPNPSQFAAAAIPGSAAPGTNANPAPVGYPANGYPNFGGVDPARSAAPSTQAAMPGMPSSAGPLASANGSLGAATPANSLAMNQGSGLAAPTADSRLGMAAANGPIGGQPTMPTGTRPAVAPNLAEANPSRPAWSPTPNAAAANPNSPNPGLSGNWPLASAQPAPTAPAAPPRAEAAPAVPAGQSPLGLEGFCPVQLGEKACWVKGDPRWGLIHRGRTYLFAGPEEQNRFYADPDRYAPVASGNDVVVAVDQGQSVQGRREFGDWFEGRVYLFASQESRARFESDPYRYSRQANPAAPAATEANRGMGVAPGQGRY